MKNRKLTREEAKQLTEKIRNTITDFFAESEANITPTMYKCDEWRESPIFHPSISIVNDNKRIGFIEINFR
jgi:hypothetical protein